MTTMMMVTTTTTMMTMKNINDNDHDEDMYDDDDYGDNGYNSIAVKTNKTAMMSKTMMMMIDNDGEVSNRMMTMSL